MDASTFAAARLHEQHTRQLEQERALRRSHAERRDALARAGGPGTAPRSARAQDDLALAGPAA